MAHHQFAGTVMADPDFNAQRDAEKIQKAMKGLGTDEKALINIICHRSNEQRKNIAVNYKTMYGSDIIKDIEGETSSDFKKVLLALMNTPVVYDCLQLKKAMKGLGTDEDALIEILATRETHEINEIKTEYKKLFKSTLESDVKGETSGDFERMLVSLMAGGRPQSGDVDPGKAKHDAEALYNAGEKQWGTDESAFNVVLCSRSHSQLRATFDEYKKLSKKDIEESISSELGGNLKTGMLAIVKSIKNRPAYFAERLYKAMKGAGTDEDTLTRVIVTRSEIDLALIKEAFQQTYKQPLSKFIQGDVGGDYGAALLAIVGK